MTISLHGSFQEFDVNKVTCIKCHDEICLSRVSSHALESHECDKCYYHEYEPEINYYEEIDLDAELDEDYFDMEVEEEYEDPACTEMYMQYSDLPGKQLKLVERLPQHEEETCSICLSTFGEDRGQIARLCESTPHLFHERCMVKWLKRSETCPLCRQ